MGRFTVRNQSRSNLQVKQMRVTLGGRQCGVRGALGSGGVTPAG